MKKIKIEVVGACRLCFDIDIDINFTTVSSVKEMVLKECPHVDVKNMTIVFGGKVLVDDKLLASYDLPKSAVLVVTTRLSTPSTSTPTQYSDQLSTHPSKIISTTTPTINDTTSADTTTFCSPDMDTTHPLQVLQNMIEHGLINLSSPLPELKYNKKNIEIVYTHEDQAALDILSSVKALELLPLMDPLLNLQISPEELSTWCTSHAVPSSSSSLTTTLSSITPSCTPVPSSSSSIPAASSSTPSSSTPSSSTPSSSTPSSSTPLSSTPSSSIPSSLSSIPAPSSAASLVSTPNTSSTPTISVAHSSTHNVHNEQKLMHGLLKQLDSISLSIQHYKEQHNFISKVMTQLREIEAMLSTCHDNNVEQIIVMTQKNVLDTFFKHQLELKSHHPIKNNTKLISLHKSITETIHTYTTLESQIDRTIYSDQVVDKLQQILALSALVGEQCDQQLEHLSALEKMYGNFTTKPVAERKNMLIQIELYSQTYVHMYQELECDSVLLKNNIIQLAALFEKNKHTLKTCLTMINDEDDVLQEQQKKMIYCVGILLGMYHQHETKRNQLTLSKQHVLQLQEKLEHQHADYHLTSTNHMEALKKSKDNAQLAGDILKKMRVMLDVQLSDLDRWMEDAQREHLDETATTLKLMYDDAMVRYRCALEIYNTCKQSIEYSEEKLRTLEDEIGLASSMRNVAGLRIQTVTKMAILEYLPEYKKSEADALKVLHHLEQVVFPSINQKLQAIHMPPHSIPDHKKSST